MASAGRKSKYIELDIETRLPEIEQMTRDGYRDKDVAKALGISTVTLYTWANKYEEFAEALRKGKEVVDAEIENKLLDNARGYTVWEETQELVSAVDPLTNRVVQQMTTTKRVLKHIRPDTTSIIFWLKNRRPNEWRDKNHVEHSGGINGFSYLSDEDLEKQLKTLENE